MVTINTNLSSILVQNNLTKSSNALNQAIERMTTGFKINGAKDNAANYSISNSYDTKINAYNVATDNIASGLDLLTTAQESIGIMQDKASRLMNLWNQAQNGTYGSQSLDSMNAEANALVTEINRTYENTEYNGIKLLSRDIELFDGLKEAGESGFIDESEEAWGEGGINVGTEETVGPATFQSYGNFIVNPKTYTDAQVAEMDRVQDAGVFTSGNTYAIYTAEELVQFAFFVNSPGCNTTNVEFVLGADIDLSAYCATRMDSDGYGGWTPIGDYSTNTAFIFKGTFDGNGHTISGIIINPREGDEKDYQGLFGRVASGVTIKNVGAEGRVKGKQFSGGLVGYLSSSDSKQSSIKNCYSNVEVTGKAITGGLVGQADTNSTVENCYATGAVTGTGSSTGGLVGYANTKNSIKNSYATGNITGSGQNTGGLVGYAYTKNSVENCYATGAVTGNNQYTGGLVGYAGSNSSVENCYATGIVSGTAGTGGLVGYAYTKSSIKNSYATGAVTGNSSIGGLVGNAGANGLVSNSYATGAVTGTGSAQNIGGLVGQTGSNSSVTNSYATGAVTGKQNIGGLVGLANKSITNSYATGNVTGNGQYTGGLVGKASGPVNNSYATGNVTGNGQYTGGLVGYANTNSSVTNSYATGNVAGTEFVGGIAGLIYQTTGSLTWTNAVSYSLVKGNDKIGSLVGGVVSTTDGSNFGAITFTDCKAIGQGLDKIGGEYKYSSSTYTPVSHGINTWLESIEEFSGDMGIRTFQVGINGGISDSISVYTNVECNLNSILSGGIQNKNNYDIINNFIKELSTRATELGAESNRLESALDSVSVNIENLTSSRSTIKDADIAKVSADYIKNQILQQASATLLATANQSPSIALQLI